LVADDAGEVVLARMEKDRDYKPLFSLDKPLELPFLNELCGKVALRWKRTYNRFIF
jgi:hypothetical protein